MYEKLDRLFGKDWQDQGYKIMDEFSSKTRHEYENGYRLILAFEAKGAIVVGTSSMDQRELRSLGISREPSLKCSKSEIPDAVVESIIAQCEKFTEKDETAETPVEQQLPKGNMR